MKVSVKRDRRLEDYRKIVSDAVLNSIMSIADKLKGLSVIHVNSTSFGGGVAEILHSMVPLMASVGLDVEWNVIEAPIEFFNITKLLHHGIQGMKVDFDEGIKSFYLKINEENVAKINLDKDFIVIHDPQPLPIKYFAKNYGLWIWRCHIDASSSYKPVWNFISKFVKLYDSYIFHMEEYVQPDLDRGKAFIMPPSIDPLTEKNREMSDSEIMDILDKFDIDPEKPILIQVARFDPWKDPIGAIKVYRKVKEREPGLQLLLVASMAHDDPEGWVYYEKAVRYAGEDYNIHFLTNVVGVGDREVNAFQRAADVALQMSIREGFGLAVTEALWKETPVVARGVGGIKLQVINGINGFIIKTVDEAAERVLYLLKNRALREKMGRRGRDHVKRNFLITRHLFDYLKLFYKLYY